MGWGWGLLIYCVFIPRCFSYLYTQNYAQNVLFLDNLMSFVEHRFSKVVEISKQELVLASGTLIKPRSFS